MALRVVFMGTPGFSVPFLSEIIGQGHEVVAVYSQPPRPAGRGMANRKSPVQQKAEQFGIPVFTPTSLKDGEAQARFASHQCDVAVVVAYGLLLPPAILNTPPLGCYNAHASLLPRWRGAAPIQRAIMAGDEKTGIAIMKMEAGLDTGPVAMVETMVIGDDMTAGELHDELSRLGANLMVRALSALALDQLDLTPQPEDGVTYAQKIDKQEARIDWQKPARAVLRHIHGLSPFPGSWCEMEQGKKPVRIKCLKGELAGDCGQASPGQVVDERLTICCGDGQGVRLTRLQRAGKQAQDAAEFLRGTPLAPGSRMV